jgi:hypothetical protein
VERASAELAKLSYREGALEELQGNHTNLKHEVNAMKQQVHFSINFNTHFSTYFRNNCKNTET